MAERTNKRMEPSGPSRAPSLLVIVPKQDVNAIQLRREIRDRFHDSRSRTIKAPKKR